MTWLAQRQLPAGDLKQGAAPGHEEAHHDADGRRRCAREALILAAVVAARTADAHDVLYLDEGRVYLGEVLEGRPHGEGRMVWPSDAVHTSTWGDGARHGAGTFREREGAAYVGEFRDGARAGKGRFTWPDGRSYDGA